MLTLGVPSSPGVPADFAKHTHVARYNDLESVKEILSKTRAAAVLVEPIAGNMGVVPPDPGFLEGLRGLTKESGALLLFDEVITGFRVSYGGCQEAFGVMPDLTTLGKIIGGGLPVGAYGGPAIFMDRLAPDGDVYQAGTLSGNPVACAAGCATLRVLRKTRPYGMLEALGSRLERGLIEAARARGVAATVNRAGSALTLFFAEGPVRSHDDLAKVSAPRYARFFHGMLERGIYLPPSAFEGWFLSTAHTGEDVDRTVAAASEVFGLAGF